MSTQPADSQAEAPSERARPTERSTKVGLAERVVSAVAGGTLLGYGLARRSLRGVVVALVGGWLLYRGLSGNGRALRALAAAAATSRARREAGAPDGVEARRSITIDRPPDELVERWRDPGELTQIVGHFAEVTPGGDGRQRWRVQGPLGWRPTWEASVEVDGGGDATDADVADADATDVNEARADESGPHLRWKSLPGGDLPNEGALHFRPAPADQGTEVTLHLRFDPPGGPLGDAVFRRLDVVPSTVTGKTLRRFKSLAETGEIPTLERNPSARGGGDLV